MIFLNYGKIQYLLALKRAVFAAELEIYFFALVFLAAGFLTTFLAGFLGEAFLVTFLATFLGEAFLAAVFLAGFLAAGFLVAVFLTTFLAAGFLTGSGLASLKDPVRPTPLGLVRAPASSMRLSASLREVAWRGPTLFFDSTWAEIAFREAPLRPEISCYYEKIFGKVDIWKFYL